MEQKEKPLEIYDCSRERIYSETGLQENKDFFCVSVIIPVFNAAKYLQCCLDSVLSQTLDNIEIICIDDGSTDDSAKIIEDYIEKIEITCGKSIRLIKQKHLGPGPARNYGIDVASGEYIAFLDSDDYYFERNALESIYRVAKSKGMKVCGGQIYCMDGEKISFALGNPNHVKEDIPKEGVELLFSETQIVFGFTSFIYEKQWINEGGIRFPNIIRFEDPVFLAEALFRCERYYIIPKKLYVVRCGHHGIYHVSSQISQELIGLKMNLKFARDNHLSKMMEKMITYINDKENMLVNNMTPYILAELLDIYCIIKGYNCNETITIVDRICSLVKDTYLTQYTTSPTSSLREWLNKLNDPINDIGAWFNNKQIYKCLVYGVGARGNAFINLLLQANIEVVGTIDVQNHSYKNIEKYSYEDNWPEADAIIVTPVGYKEILNSLKRKNCKNIILLDEVLNNIFLYSKAREETSYEVGEQGKREKFTL